MARLKELTELDASGYVPAETYLLAEDSSEESKKVKARTLLSGVAADLSAEVTARANADTALQGSIDTITVKIPAAASDLNQLADKAFVTGITDTKAAKAESVGSFTLSMDSSTFVITLQAKDVNGSNLGSAQTIDLPLESVVVSGSYDPTSKKVILALKDGSTVEFSVADLISGLQSEITGAATSITGTDLSASKALVSDSNGKVAASSVSASELDHLSGVTSPIQTQINGLSEAISAEVSERETVTGDLSDLTTVSKTNLVSAINEAAASGGGGSSQISVTWADLKTARDGGLLTPGQQYRITDYVTTTVQPETQSAGHAFDIIVTADSGSVLNENARAAIHAGDTYFADSKLQAWKLKYCLDNDTDRFAWADSVNGKGVIYQMTDEFENALPYDFKNIQFKRYKITAKTTATKPDDLVSGYYGMRSSENPASATGALYPSGYTIDTADTVFRFTFDYNGADYSLNKYASKSGTEWSKYCYGNEIAPYYYKQKQGLNNVVFGNTAVNSENYRNKLTGARIFSNTFGNNCSSNTFGNFCYFNTFGNNCSSNTFGNYCYFNTFGNNCYSNTFGNYCQNNTFGNFCQNNTFGNYCSSNTFGNYCQNNTFGNSCQYNTFGNFCQNNTFGNYCSSNTFGNYCYFNTFGNNCSSNTFLDGYSALNGIVAGLKQDDGDDQYSIVLSNQSAQSVTVTGQYAVELYEDYDSGEWAPPYTSFSHTIAAGDNWTLASMDESDDDMICNAVLSYTRAGKTISASMWID